MQILLPEKVDLTCRHCRETFSIYASCMHRRMDITCPFCGERSNLIDCLPTRIRRQIYHALRDDFEQRIYARHQALQPDSGDPWSGDSEE